MVRALSARFTRPDCWIAVTALARGIRLKDIRKYGLGLEDIISGHGPITQVDITESLNPDDRYDAVFVAVRRDQLDSVLQDLAAKSAHSHHSLHDEQPEWLAPPPQNFGRGAGAARLSRDGHMVSYTRIEQQPTTMG
jgi:hypothetical protein